jgi:kumamolisin
MNSKKVTLVGSERQPIGTRVGDQPQNETIEVSVILKPKARAQAPLDGGATVTREEFAAKHGADTADIAKVKEFAKEYNLSVGETSVERRTVKLEGTAAEMTSAFGVNLARYEHDGQQYRARSGTIQIPAELEGSVEAVLGLDDRPQAKPHYRVHGKKAAPAAAAVSYSPRQVAQLYQFPLDVNGAGQTVGIIELGAALSLPTCKPISPL